MLYKFLDKPPNEILFTYTLHIKYSLTDLIQNSDDQHLHTHRRRFEDLTLFYRGLKNKSFFYRTSLCGKKTIDRFLDYIIIQKFKSCVLSSTIDGAEIYG